MAQKQQNSLDNLMMTFADLNATGKSSFKGPALKDVKKVNHTQKSSAFQPSQKARDWSSLEQSLESVFSVQDQVKNCPATQLPFQPQFANVQQPKVEENNDDDEFSDFVGPSTSQTVSVPNAGIGSRLATFQDESPVHQFKAKPPDWTSTGQDYFSSPISIQPNNSENFVGFPEVAKDIQDNDNDEEDDFGDFAAPVTKPAEPIKTLFPAFDPPSIPISIAPQPLSQFEVQPSAPKVQAPPPIFNLPIETKPAIIPKTTILPLQPALNTNSNDKYSALRDFFTDDSGTPEQQTSSLPVLESSNVIMEEAEDDDFGDFVTTISVTQQAPLSLPISDAMFQAKSSSLLPDETVFTSSKSKPKIPEDKFVPWLESSPPPPPVDIEDNLTIEDLNVDGEGFLNDDPFFGSSLTSHEQNQVEDLSITSLNLRSITPKIEHEESFQEPIDEDANEQESLDNNQEKDIIADNIEKEALKLFQCTLQLLDVNESVLKEVLGADKTKSFLWNLVQVYRVCQRVKQGRQRQDSFQLVDESWNKIQNKVKTTYSFTPLLWDFRECFSNANSSSICKICLLDLSSTSKETRIKDLVESVITQENDCSYHSICANFWINIVNQVLPN